MNIVADTNILVNAIIRPNGRFPRELRLDNFSILFSYPTRKELIDVLGSPHLRSKYNLTPEYIHSFLQLLQKRSTLIEVSETITECRDNDDNKFLEVAVSGMADAMVTNDSDLLVLHPFRGIPIFSLDEFWNFLNQ